MAARYRICLSLLVWLLVAVPAFSPAQTSPRTVYLPYDEARPLLALLEEILPAALKNQKPEAMPQVWAEWVVRHDAEVRARLAQGDVDTLINFLLFGTSFTKQPRLTASELVQLKKELADGVTATGVTKVFEARINDLVAGLAAPGTNERLLFLRRLVQQQGQQTATAAGRTKLKDYLRENLRRIISENESYARTLEAARLQGGASEEFIERSKLYRTRGLSLDTSLMPNFAIEESLKALKSRGLLAAGSVHRVAVIGPGLDFADKAGGYDFYPEQTIQPFALIDSLLRVGLAKNDALQLTTLDISPRVNAHLARARQRARNGQGYTVQLPLDSQIAWQPGALRYWQQFGDQTGREVKPIAPPAGLGTLKLRAVMIRPEVVSRISHADLNIVLQRLSQAEPFDLIVATNILVYYDEFEQSLALRNIAAMLKPGGFLLSNNALLELPGSPMKSVDYLSVAYSDRATDGDHIVWYQRQP
ncbi:MAG: CheR family methyltransferase [Blastocatellia bacterium]